MQSCIRATTNYFHWEAPKSKFIKKNHFSKDEYRYSKLIMKSDIKIIAENRRARYEYEIIESFEAGIELFGSEVKSMRATRVTILECYAGPMNNQLYLFLMVPFLYLLIAEGMTLVLREWREVFPRNPIARFIGTILVSIAVLTTGLYHMNRYYIAWHNFPETRAIYKNPPPR